MLKTLVAIPERCTGCHRCEMWCSIRHKGVINIERAAVHVIRQLPSIDDPRVCLQCGICIDSCPKDLITRNKKTGAVEIDKGKCTHCGYCILSCPYGMITFDPVDGHAVKCDLCGGQPECVKHCREEAILYMDADKAARHRRDANSKRDRQESKKPNIRQSKAG
ncbi:MAG TPA: 4Fe-4S dicluster domain-containing protein [Thermodesulfobacteriota bacterium]|nr:4Fe-4S dicluster domain-containing protein [Thermodesulfobacteriota bacterium]